ADPTKAFVPREVRSRAAAMMRRPRGSALTDAGNGAVRVANPDSPELEGDSLIRHNGLEFNYDTRTVAVDGKDLQLTRTEFDLLYALLQAGRVVRTKADLVRRL